MSTALAKPIGPPWWVWAALVGGHLCFFCYGSSHKSWIFPDSDRYLQAAYNLWKHGELYARPWPGFTPNGQAIQEFSIRPPGYPLIIGLLGGFKTKPILLLAVQNLLSLATIGCVLTWWGRETQPSKREWVGAAALLFFPAQLIYANTVMSETILQSVVLVLAFSGIRFWQRLQTQYLIAVVAALSLALLLKPVFFPLAGLAFLVIAGIAWSSKKVSWGLIGALPLFVAMAYMQWNSSRTGHFHFSSIAEINLLHYNAAGVIRQTRGAEEEDGWVHQVLQNANAQPSFRQRQQYIQGSAMAVIKAHPLVYARQHLQGMAGFFLDPGRFDISQFLHLPALAGGGLLAQLRADGVAGIAKALRQLPLALLGTLGLIMLANLARLVLAVAGFLYLRKSEKGMRAGRWLLAGLLLYVAFLTGPLGAARFMVPVWPLLLVLSLCGLKAIGLSSHDKPPMSEKAG